MLRINELKLPLTATPEDLRRAAARELGIRESDINHLQLCKKAVDARKKSRICFSYSVEVTLCRSEEKVLRRCRSKKVSRIKKQPYILPPAAARPSLRPLIIGMGPAGLLCGLTLAEAGFCPILLERGEDIIKRRKTVAAFWREGVLNPESNVQFGQGGAGAFSDGKLTTNTKDPRNRRVLETFVAAGAPSEILYLAKPHIGTDLLIDVVRRLGERIETLGGELRCNCRVDDFRLETTGSGSRLRGVRVQDAAGFHWLESEDVVLAIGHSARDTFEKLYQLGVPMTAKPFSVGARIEHFQRDIDRSQYGAFAGHSALSAADYQLSCHLPDGRSVYSFCMCPGGVVVNASSEPGQVVTNGMSLYARNGENANAALLVGITPADFGSDHPLAGMALQRTIEKAAFQAAGGNYRALCQRVGDFLANRPTRQWGKVRPSFLPGVCPGAVDDCLPPFVTAALRQALPLFAEKITAFGDEDALLTAPETRSSSPVRILRDESRQSACRGLYPCGEGAGYAGGIMSAAADGIRVAEALIQKYNPPETPRD